jgi:hypothetical protein
MLTGSLVSSRTQRRKVAVGQPPDHFAIAIIMRRVGSAPGEYMAAAGGRMAAADACTPQSL